MVHGPKVCRFRIRGPHVDRALAIESERTAPPGDSLTRATILFLTPIPERDVYVIKPSWVIGAATETASSTPRLGSNMFDPDGVISRILIAPVFPAPTSRPTPSI
ncbi:unnamed protein product [Agarophyton chilense]